MVRAAAMHLLQGGGFFIGSDLVFVGSFPEPDCNMDACLLESRNIWE